MTETPISWISEDEEPRSNCCSAPIVSDNVCEQCKNHCVKIWTCQACKGKGEYQGPTEEMTGCEICNGTGELVE